MHHDNRAGKYLESRARNSDIWTERLNNTRTASSSNVQAEWEIIIINKKSTTPSTRRQKLETNVPTSYAGTPNLACPIDEQSRAWLEIARYSLAIAR